jgi:hypothetical protein
MKRSLQLRIPTPCQEDWTHMQPTEKGRHCESCCKTVVDFTAMSDTEIISYLSKAGPHVCGRLMPDQLGRRLAPAPVQKNGRSGWAWALASLLMLAKGSDDRRPVKGGKVEMGAPVQRGDSTVMEPAARGEADKSQIFTGMILTDVRSEVVDSPVRRQVTTRIVPDKERAVMGKPALGDIKGEPEMGDIVMVPVKDSILASTDTERPPVDTLPVKPKDPSQELTAFTGGILVEVKIDTVVDILADTLRQIAADTLAALGWQPTPILNIYPNPVLRGSMMQLAWKTQPGQYQITFMDSRGQLIAERVLDVGGMGQVDSWEIPASLAAGIYILRVARAGGAAGSAGSAGAAATCTREVMVR